MMKKIIHRSLPQAVNWIFSIFYVSSLLFYSFVVPKESDFQFQAASPRRKAPLHSFSGSPDGTFNGFNLYHVKSPPKTTIHCVDENFHNQRSWLFRLCEFKTLCFDLDKRDIVMYVDSPDDIPENWRSSTQLHPKRAITRFGELRPRLGNPPSSYYRFNATLLPFFRHPTSYRNLGRLLWDDFLSMYTLLDIFDRVDDKQFLAQMRRPRTETSSEPKPPFDIIEKFLPLMGNFDYNLDIFQHYNLQIEHPNFKNDKTERVVCADYGLIGSGMFSDHGESHWHVQWKSDRVLPHNIGQGGLFRRYRSFLMKNVGISSQQRTMQRQPYKIVVSISSSTKADRANVSFASKIKALSQLEPRVEIQAVQMSKLSLPEQIQLISTAAFYVSMTGGGTAPAMFLPKRAHLILYYVPPRYLDWDFWNNFPHIHTDWIPRLRNDRGESTTLDNVRLLELVTRELNILEQGVTKS